jgi:hypothetical protein
MAGNNECAFDLVIMISAAIFGVVAITGLPTNISSPHASAVAQGNVVRAMSASCGKSLNSILRRNQTP